jgi:polyhydroxybutyrate depolymerase
MISVATVTIAACSSGSSSSSSSTTTRASTAASNGKGGCGGTAKSGTTTFMVGAGSARRTAIVHVPASYHPPAPVALVLNLHGSGSTAASQMAFTGMNATSDADGFIVAYPQGVIPSGRGFDWNVPGQPLLGGGQVPAGAANDVAYLSQLVTALEQRYCVDARHVDATGFSGGARMTSQLGCDAATRIAAIAPVSGLRFPSPCAGTRPMPVVSFHGTADPVDPYGGNGQAYWTYSVPGAAQRWAGHDACRMQPSSSTPAKTAQLTIFTPCSGGAAVELYTLAGAGHTWPGGPPLPAALQRELGPTSHAVDANTTMWRFFEQHPLR